jgi:DNA helicase-2/ATP-dependent DNA helicase PcrA
MEEYSKDFIEEEKYLNHTISQIEEQLEAEERQLTKRKRGLAASRREMWEESGNFPTDFSGIAEISQYRAEAIVQTETYLGNLTRVDRYRRMLEKPYFGRFDLLEEGEKDSEKIYLGLGTLMDSQNYRVLVYDWRAPVCSVFYRHELGPAQYETPSGTVRGEVVLKRQYKIRNGKLQYFFDSGIVIRDDMLQEILSRNASVQMRTIVESIQKEQDIVIRDTSHGLVIVQGAAGSGKTSIALHRVAFLLYEGLGSNLNSRNILIISPNQVFSQYIASVLPDLGEENVEQLTFDEICRNNLKGSNFETKGKQLERIIEGKIHTDLEEIDFKGSSSFVTILERLLWHLEHRLIAFEDIYYHGKVIATRQQLKNRFLKQKNVPVASRLRYLEDLVWEEVRPLRQERQEIIEEIVQRSECHDLEIKAFSRYLSLKETNRLKERMHKFTRVDYRALYQRLFNPDLFFRLSQGLPLPPGINGILEQTRNRLEQGKLSFEDASALLYLKLRLEGADSYPWFRHVVIDEAQDYSKLHYEVFKLLFRFADFTVLGDVHQSMERDVEMSLYDEIVETFPKKKFIKLVLSKTYRSSYEITQFARGLLGLKSHAGAFERHDEAPQIHAFDSRKDLEKILFQDALAFLEQGFGSVAIICKTKDEAKGLYDRLKPQVKIQLIEPHSKGLEKGISIIPVYLAKGLEFDAVLVYETNAKHYFTELDNRLLYIACTRALHRLRLYHTGKRSPLLPHEV